MGDPTKKIMQGTKKKREKTFRIEIRNINRPSTSFAVSGCLWNVEEAYHVNASTTSRKSCDDDGVESGIAREEDETRSRSIETLLASVRIACLNSVSASDTAGFSG